MPPSPSARMNTAVCMNWICNGAPISNKHADTHDPRSEALLNAYQQLERRQADYENVIAGLNQEMADIETETSQTILSIQADYYQKLIATSQDMQEKQLETQTIFQTILNERTRYFEEVIQSEQSKTQNRVNALFQQITSIAKDQEKKEDYTRQWIENCHSLSEFIEDRYDHQKFFPREFDQVLQRLNVAERDLKRGFIDSGMQFAQESFLKLSELRVALEEKTSEWQALYEVIKAEVEKVSLEVSNTPHIPALGIDGEELDIQIDLEFWSNSRYSIVQNALETLSSEIKTDIQQISFEDLQRISAEIIPKYRREFSDTIFEARQSALSSQLKINVAYLAMKALEKHGFSLEQAQFDNEDQREPFSAQLCGIDGSNIILQITPNADNKKTNNLILQTLDDSIHTEDDFMQRWQEINSSLQQAGVEVGPVQVNPIVLEKTDQASVSQGRKPFNRPTPYSYVQQNCAASPTNHQ